MGGVANNSRIVMKDITVKELDRFLDEQGISTPFKKKAIKNGRNSKVWKISNPKGHWILKQYYQHDADKRDRLRAEASFLELLRNIGVDTVSNVLGMNKIFNIALYSFLPGGKPTIISSNHIRQAAKFINDINQLRYLPDSNNISPASDACFCLLDHFNLVDNRISSLTSIKPISKLETEVFSFVNKQLKPAWEKLKKQLLSQFGSSQLKKKLSFNERILSPSDFGFHNTLEYKNNLFFVDFEYAGWDDPAKLICDFICQPEVPVPEYQCNYFIENIQNYLPRLSGIKSRVDYLLPLHRIKWCCILLNEFKVEDRKRRLYAGVESEGLLEDQFRKASEYFNLYVL